MVIVFHNNLDPSYTCISYFILLLLHVFLVVYTQQAIVNLVIAILIGLLIQYLGHLGAGGDKFLMLIYLIICFVNLLYAVSAIIHIGAFLNFQYNAGLSLGYFLFYVLNITGGLCFGYAGYLGYGMWSRW